MNIIHTWEDIISDNIFSTLEVKLHISAWPCNILFILYYTAFLLLI